MNSSLAENDTANVLRNTTASIDDDLFNNISHYLLIVLFCLVILTTVVSKYTTIMFDLLNTTHISTIVRNKAFCGLNTFHVKTKS